MIRFPFNENRFSFFFVADHLLVGKLSTNPKSDRSLLSCLKVTQCSTSDIGDAPLYNSCPLPIQVMTTGPLPAPSKCKSVLFNVPRVMKTKFPATVMVFGVVSSDGHIMPLHIFEVGLKVNRKVYLDVLKSVVIPWCNQVAGGSRTLYRLTSPKRPRLGFRRSATTLYPSVTGPLLHRPEPAGLLRLVIHREHYQPQGIPTQWARAGLKDQMTWSQKSVLFILPRSRVRNRNLLSVLASFWLITYAVCHFYIDQPKFVSQVDDVYMYLSKQFSFSFYSERVYLERNLQQNQGPNSSYSTFTQEMSD